MAESEPSTARPNWWVWPGGWEAGDRLPRALEPTPSRREPRTGTGVGRRVHQPGPPRRAEHDVVLGLENHYKDGFWSYPEFAQNQDVFLALLDAIRNSGIFGVQYDPSNAIVAGDDPIALSTCGPRPRRQHACQGMMPDLSGPSPYSTGSRYDASSLGTDGDPLRRHSCPPTNQPISAEPWPAGTFQLPTTIRNPPRWHLSSVSPGRLADLR